MFDQILIPTDGSDPSANAARNGVELAAEHGATVHVISVVEPPALGKFTAGFKPASAEHDEAIEQLRAAAQDAIDGVVDSCDEHDVDVVETLKYGPPAEQITTYSEEEGIDVIVMGTHGREGAERLVIGSVAEKVVRRSPVPVMTVQASE